MITGILIGLYLGIGIVFTLIFSFLAVLGADGGKLLAIIATCPWAWPAWVLAIMFGKV